MEKFGEVDLLAIKEQPNGELLVLLSHRGDRLVYEGQSLLDKSGFLLLSLSVESGRLAWFKTFDCLAPNRGRLALDEQGQIYLGLSFSKQLKLGHRQNQLLRAAGEQDLAILALDRGEIFDGRGYWVGIRTSVWASSYTCLNWGFIWGGVLRGRRHLVRGLRRLGGLEMPFWSITARLEIFDG